MDEKAGFFGSLFDFSFSEFVTTRVIKVLYVLAILFSALAVLVLIVGSFKAGAVGVIITLLLSPVIFLLNVLLSRIWLELIIVIFRIAENTSRLVEQGKGE